MPAEPLSVMIRASNFFREEPGSLGAADEPGQG